MLKKQVSEGKHQFSNNNYGCGQDDETKKRLKQILRYEIPLTEEIVEETLEVEPVIMSPRRTKKAFEYRIEGDGIVSGRNRKPFKM
jgi:hypothetical protein